MYLLKCDENKCHIFFLVRKTLKRLVHKATKLRLLGKLMPRITYSEEHFNKTIDNSSEIESKRFEA